MIDIPNDVRKRRCTKCVCPLKNHKENVADGFVGIHSWGDFYTVQGKPDPWVCWMNPKRSCKGCSNILQELSLQ